MGQKEKLCFGDYQRQTFLENQGYTVLRFAEYLVVYRIDEVISEIDYSIKCIEKQIEEKN